MNPDPARSTHSEPLFLELCGRRLFALLVSPVGQSRGTVLYLPPFAEEMNRCRCHVADQARALAATGLTCLLLDLYGTGESDGDITDPDWSTWLADALAATQWLRQRYQGPLTAWGLRTGALLAAQLADNPDAGVSQLLLWQPVVDGQLFLNQYLRLRIASQMVRDTERETTDTIRQRLAAGEILEIAGYPLTGRMAEGLAARRLGDSHALARVPVRWVELVSKAGQPLAVASRRVVEALNTAGAQISTATVACPLIWQLHEREEAPELVQTTMALMGAPT